MVTKREAPLEYDLARLFTDQPAWFAQEAVPHLGEMLGYGEKHKIEWSNLNKGAHEEDRGEEFDAVIVRRMLETVIKLDEAIESTRA